MFYSISAVLALYGFWLLLSGYFTAFLMGAGLACALAVVWFARRMDVIDQEGHPIHLGWRSLYYWPWLTAQVGKSAWEVARIIVHPSLPISPTLVRVRPTQKTDLGLVVHANSITLTPGTISVEVGADEILVHALTRDGADDVSNGAMDKRVTAFEGRA